MNIGLIILVVIVALAAFLIGLYNRLVRLNVRVQEAWSDIDVQFKRRFDLIPNLIETVKGYMAHEKDVLESLVDARTKASSVNIDISNVTKEQMELFAGAQSGLSGSLGRLLAVGEAHPDLKASANFLQLQTDLTDTEDKIQASRRFYNGTVREMNTLVLSFPANLIANMFGFGSHEFFEIENEKEKEPVKVDFTA